MTRKILGKDELHARVMAELAKCSWDEIVKIVVGGVLEVHKLNEQIEQLKKQRKKP